MAYEDELAAAPPEVQAFAARLEGWVDERGWSTEPTAKGLKLLTGDGTYVCRFQPTLAGVEVDLRRFRRRGLDAVADDMAARAKAVTADEDLTDRSIQVPLVGIERNWDRFFDGFLRVHLAAVEKADREGPDPGHASCSG